jgi:hypothetical protein
MPGLAGVGHQLQLLQEVLQAVKAARGEETAAHQRQTQPDTEEFDCALCCKLLYQPVTTPCGHSFCKACFSRTLDHQNKCAASITAFPLFLCYESHLECLYAWYLVSIILRGTVTCLAWLPLVQSQRLCPTASEHT